MARAYSARKRPSNAAPVARARALLGAEGLGCAKAQGQCVRHLDFERPRMFAHYIHSASRKKQNAPCPKGYLSRRLIANGFVFVSPRSAGAQDTRRHGLARHSAKTADRPQAALAGGAPCGDSVFDGGWGSVPLSRPRAAERLDPSVCISRLRFSR